MENILKVKNLTKVFNQGEHSEVEAVSDINLDVDVSSVLLIMGPSGSGKTTLLTMI